MQPYFFPYIGYFQLINAVDEFLIYNNIEYSKEGWINRNRILVQGKDAYITLPLKKDSDYLEIRNRSLAATWLKERKLMLSRIANCYRKAPHFANVYPMIEKCIMFDENNLFQFLLNSLNQVKYYLEIQTPFVVSSTISIDHDLRAEKKVIALCKARNANKYINPIGGSKLYNKDDFMHEGINLYFLKPSEIIYKQFEHDYLPSLSIIDVMMFNSKEVIQKYLTSSFLLI